MAINNLNFNDLTSLERLTTKETNAVIGGISLPEAIQLGEAIYNKYISPPQPPQPPQPKFYQPPFLGPEFAVPLPAWMWSQN